MDIIKTLASRRRVSLPILQDWWIVYHSDNGQGNFANISQLELERKPTISGKIYNYPPFKGGELIHIDLASFSGGSINLSPVDGKGGHIVTEFVLANVSVRINEVLFELGTPLPAYSDWYGFISRVPASAILKAWNSAWSEFKKIVRV